MPEDTPISPIPTLPPIVTADALEVALLRNNVVISKSIADSGDKITKAVNDKMDAFISAVKDLAKDQTKLETDFTTFKADVSRKLQGIWGKVVVIAGVSSFIFGVIGYFIGSGHFLPH